MEMMERREKREMQVFSDKGFVPFHSLIQGFSCTDLVWNLET